MTKWRSSRSCANCCVRSVIEPSAHCVADALDVLGSGIVVGTIISDFRMPGPSGLDLLRSCRTSQSARQRNCRFYLMTGQTDLTDAALQELAQSGAVVIGKPIGPRKLLGLVAGEPA